MNNYNGTATLESMSQAVWYNRWTVRKFDKYLKGKILEIGCGIGNFTKLLIGYGEVFAIDIDKHYVAAAIRTVKGKAKIEYGDIEDSNYFFGGQKFDTIICLNVLEHIKDDGRALRNMYSLLEKNGFLVLLVPAHDFLFGEIDKSIGHFRRYNKGKLLNLMKSIGFKIIKARLLNVLGAVGWWFAGKLLKNKDVGKGKVKLFNVVAPMILPIEDVIEPPFGTSVLVIARK